MSFGRAGLVSGTGAFMEAVPRNAVSSRHWGSLWWMLCLIGGEGGHDMVRVPVMLTYTPTECLVCLHLCLSNSAPPGVVLFGCVWGHAAEYDGP